MLLKKIIKTFSLVFVLGAALLGCDFAPKEGVRNNPIVMEAEKWTDGELKKTKDKNNNEKVGTQWFQFMATASTQYIYVKFGTADRVGLSLCDSNYNQLGDEHVLTGSTSEAKSVSYSVTTGSVYYVKVTDSSHTGTYQVGFTDFPAQPGTQRVLLPNGLWKDGNIVQPKTGGTGEEWFEFRADSDTQFVYVKQLTIGALYLSLYDKNLAQIGDSSRINRSTGEVSSLSYSLSAGDSYYIKVYDSRSAGTYQIGFTNSPMQPEITLLELNYNEWKDGDIKQVESGGTGEQWFKFNTTTAATQYIYLKRNSIYRVTAFIYDMDLKPVGKEFYTDGGVKYASYQVTKGEYYIKTASGYDGTYQIGFTNLPVQPGTEIDDEKNKLTENEWKQGNIKSADAGGTGEQCFSFTATADTQYLYLKDGTISCEKAFVYDKDFNMVGKELDSEWTDINHEAYSLNKGKTYYIIVYGQGYAGSYWVGFTTLPADPGTNPIELIEEKKFVNGNIKTRDNGGTGEQWFKFKATASIQYIYLKDGTAKNEKACVYDKEFNIIGKKLDTSWTDENHDSYSLTVGDEYYIVVSDSSGGSYKVAFSSTEEEPSE